MNIHQQAIQDSQIFKERHENSPGIVIFNQGDWWHPTPDRLQLLNDQNYYVLTAANGSIDIPFWITQERCIGGMFGHRETVEAAKSQYPEKIFERFEGVGSRFLRSITQDIPYALWYSGIPWCDPTPRNIKTVDVVASFSPVALKRGDLLIASLIQANVSAYVFAHSFGSDQISINNLLTLVKALGGEVEYFQYPFDPYALIKINNHIIIDCRPMGANNSIVSNYLSRAKLFIHTSTTEGFSNAVMEALSNDVPILICDDIQGPLQTLSVELPQCFTRAQPNVSSLIKNIRDILSSQPPTGSVRNAFKALLDPFEINRRMVLGAQTWFEKKGLQWKGHCLGIFGGVQSKLDLANTNAEESYRGFLHIYPNLVNTANYINFQISVSEKLGAKNNAEILKREALIVDAMRPS